MKRLFVSFIISALIFFMMAGADFRLQQDTPARIKKTCIGYTVIEVNKGIDCNGDTISLVKSHGYFQFASK